MTDYKRMYYTLFQAYTKAIEILQQAQQEAEEIYINAEQSNSTEHTDPTERDK